MSRIWTLALFLVICLLGAAPPRDQPTREQITRWIEDLASEDSEIWRAASDRLWKAGRTVEPALRAAMKHPDPDVILRARVILGRLEWGIYPDTPAAIVRAIERYYEGDLAQKQAVVEELIKLGRPGYSTLRRLIARETNVTLRTQVAEKLQKQYRRTVRELIVSGDRTGAMELLEAAAASGNEEVMRDLAALLVLMKEERKIAPGDKKAAVLAAYLYRAKGDLPAARVQAQSAGDNDLLAGILDELEDFKALASLNHPEIAKTPGKLAAILAHAGDKAGSEAALARIPTSEHWWLTTTLFCNDRPRQATESYRRTGDLAGVCQFLALQGLRKEALAMNGDGETKDVEQRTRLLLEQVVLTWHSGEREKARKMFRQALEASEKALAMNDFLLSRVLIAGNRMGQRKEVLIEIGQVLDRVKPATLRSLLHEISARDGETMVLWWDYLRKRSFPNRFPRRLWAACSAGLRASLTRTLTT
jgi:hypothetical protein